MGAGLRQLRTKRAASSSGGLGWGLRLLGIVLWAAGVGQAALGWEGGGKRQGMWGRVSIWCEAVAR